MNTNVQRFLELIVCEGETLLEFTPELQNRPLEGARKFVEQLVQDGEALLAAHGAPLPNIDARLIN